MTGSSRSIPAQSGESSQVGMDELPASLLTTLLEERTGGARARKA